jgi:HSP20 family protein
VDVLETEKAVVVRVAVAGVAIRDLRVGLEGQLLCVRGTRSQPRGEEEVLRHHQLEIEPGPFEARVRLPVSVERDQVSARLEDGVLTVRLPKRAPRRIEVGRDPREGT